jgi:D-xylose transport system permease protein
VKLDWAPAAKTARNSLRLRSGGVIYAYLLLVGLLTLNTAMQGKPFYLSPLNVSNVLDQSSLIGLMAIFMTLVLISGNFDLSVASTAALSGAVALSLIDRTGPAVAILAGLAVGAVVGVINGLLVQKVGVNAFIVTLGTMTVVRGADLALLQGQSISPEDQFFYELATTKRTVPVWAVIASAVVLVVLAALRIRKVRHGRRIVDGISLVLMLNALALVAVALLVPALLTQVASVWVLLTAMVLVMLFLRFTIPGRYLYATGSNEEAARLAGVNVDRYKIGVFIAMGMAAALAGLLYSGKFNSMDPNSLTGSELTVLASAILGGTSLQGGSGYATKSVVGTLILFTLANGFNVLNLGPNYQYLVQGAVLVAAATLYTVTSRKKKHSSVKGESSLPPAPIVPADSAHVG